MTHKLARPRHLALALVVALVAALTPVAHAAASEPGGYEVPGGAEAATFETDLPTGPAGGVVDPAPEVEDPGLARTDAEVDDQDATFETASTTGLPIRPEVRAVRDLGPNVRIRGGGWGHGVGLSQYGAYAQAQAGWSAEEILGFYYPGITVTADTRTSERRIRVSIVDDVASTTVEAVSGPLEWQRCQPDEALGETIDGRVTDCLPWFTQAQGTTLVVCPYREPATDADTGEPVAEADRRDGVRVLLPAAHDADGCTGAAEQLTYFAVARIDHDGTTIRTPSHSGLRPYRDGWRDLHVRADGTKLDAVQDVPSIERYLRGLDEVPASWGRVGPAALRAQAITGRTFALGRLGISPVCACDIRATPADQNYTGYTKEFGYDGDLWVAAVDATKDRVLTYQGALAQTFYSSSHGGHTENVEDSWAFGTTPIPYLRSREDPWSLDARTGNSRASWQAFADNGVMASFLSAGQSPAITLVERIGVVERTDGGTPRQLEVTGTTSDGQRVSFTTDLQALYAKGIAGAAMRRDLVLVAGGSGGRLFSSQLQDFTYAPFGDDDGNVHEFAISWAFQAGIVAGVDDTNFAPGRAVTRAQMATFLVNTFEVDVPTPSRVFSDVAPGDTHAANIQALVDASVANGYRDGTFRPDEAVTREQMATFLAGALALSSPNTGTFADVSGRGVHDAAVEAIAQAGITSGCDATRFCPAEPVQRDQLASFVRQAVTS